MDTSMIISTQNHSSVNTKISQLEMQLSSFDVELQQAIKQSNTHEANAIQTLISKLSKEISQLKSVSEIQGVSQQAQISNVLNNNNPSSSSSAKMAVDTLRGTGIDTSV
ncbi:hypothetical protein [Clostridium oryzae]|uniref:FlxA-like protein n=1 Tax=Clostridium oryzae TaxID=1450648 RepID=A0A1V4IRW7_9CLOT|nr:hypothetical protein [Clostridium oryzae]OPJ62544.1 hypothetical protein CLORY_16740 [Clostridium oryzae]